MSLTAGKAPGSTGLSGTPWGGLNWVRTLSMAPEHPASPPPRRPTRPITAIVRPDLRVLAGPIAPIIPLSGITRPPLSNRSGKYRSHLSSTQALGRRARRPQPNVPWQIFRCEMSPLAPRANSRHQPLPFVSNRLIINSIRLKRGALVHCKSLPWRRCDHPRDGLGHSRDAIGTKAR